MLSTGNSLHIRFLHTQQSGFSDIVNRSFFKGSVQKFFLFLEFEDKKYLYSLLKGFTHHIVILEAATFGKK